jgi:hypothetical protein
MPATNLVADTAICRRFTIAIATIICWLVLEGMASGEFTALSCICERVFEGKLWIERDETEEGVTQDLLDRGVSQKDIVLAFYHYEDRKLTDFAIA